MKNFTLQLLMHDVFDKGQKGDPYNLLWPMQWQALIGQREDLFGQNAGSSFFENVSPHFSGNIEIFT